MLTSKKRQEVDTMSIKVPPSPYKNKDVFLQQLFTTIIYIK